MLLVGQTLKYEIGPWANSKLEDPTSIWSKWNFKTGPGGRFTKDQYVCAMEEHALLYPEIVLFQIQGIPK